MINLQGDAPPPSTSPEVVEPYIFEMEEQDLAHFHAIPWCSRLLQDPAFKITPTCSRQPKSSTEDSLIAESLRTDSTISRCLTLYKPPSAGSNFVTEVRTLVSLGSGMNGGAHVLHGGMVATLMDDVMGTLLTVNKTGEGAPLTASTVTASLEVKYLKPVRTPKTVCVVARCKEMSGRKFWLLAEIEDEDGVVLARGQALWIKLNQQRERGEEKGKL